jgi:hypothetical protein
MDIFDKFFKKYSYKFPKGYPDMDNVQDVLLLESILYNLGTEVQLNEEVPNKSKTIQAVKYIIDTVGSKYGLFAGKSKPNRLGLTGKKDSQFFIDLFKEVFGPETKVTVFPPRKGSNPSGSFNMYQVDTKDFGQVNIIVSSQAPGGHGKDNESIFIDTLNSLIKQVDEKNGATIEITAPEYKEAEIFDNITNVIDSSQTKSQENFKSDAQFLDKNTVKANISLKKDNGFRWASVASYYPELIKKFEKKAFDGDIPGLTLKPNPDVKGKYLMYSSNSGERISKIIIPDFVTDEKDMNIFIFGEEKPPVIVVSRTWSESDFQLNEDTKTITVKASHIYKNLEDIKKANLPPVFVITQHQNKPIGLDYRIFPKNSTEIKPDSRAKVLTLSINDII